MYALSESHDVAAKQMTISKTSARSTPGSWYLLESVVTLQYQS